MPVPLANDDALPAQVFGAFVAVFDAPEVKGFFDDLLNDVVVEVDVLFAPCVAPEDNGFLDVWLKADGALLTGVLVGTVDVPLKVWLKFLVRNPVLVVKLAAFGLVATVLVAVDDNGLLLPVEKIVRDEVVIALLPTWEPTLPAVVAATLVAVVAANLAPTVAATEAIPFYIKSVDYYREKMSSDDESIDLDNDHKDDKKKVNPGKEEDGFKEQEVNDIASVVATMKVPFSSIVVSKRNSGKSFMVKDLCYNLSVQKRIHQVIVMSNTSGLSLNKDYDFVDKKFLTTFAQEKIERLMKLQTKAIKAGKIREILLVLDDVIGGDGTKKAEGNRLIRSLYANGRHFHISVILLSQIANRLLEPPLRENSDYIFFSRLGMRGLETLWESIPVIRKKEFIRFASTHNKDYTFILYDNMTQSNDPIDFLYLVKADERKFLLNQKAMEK